MFDSDDTVKIEMLAGMPFKQFPVRCSVLWLVIFYLYNYMDHEKSEGNFIAKIMALYFLDRRKPALCGILGWF